MMPTSRKAAKAAGVQKYDTGKPCRSGHMAPRTISQARCVECRRIRSARDWTVSTAEKIAKQAAYYRANREDCLRKMKEYRKAHLAQKRAANKAWAVANPEKDRESKRKWMANNPEKVRARTEAARARRKGAEGRYTGDEVLALLERQKGRCPICQTNIRRKYHADHIVPIVLGGSNWISNIQLLCPPCNWRKSGKDPVVFAQQEGRLL